PALRDRLVGMHDDADARSGGAVNVTTVLFVARLQAAERWIVIMQLDTLDPRREQRRDLVVGRSRGSRGHGIGERALERWNAQLVTAAGTFHRDRHRFSTGLEHDDGRNAIERDVTAADPR